MRVLIVPSWYPTEFNNVTGSFFKEQAECIAKNEVNVTVFAINSLSIIDFLKHPFKSNLFKLKHYYENNVNTYVVNVCSFGLNKTNLFYNIYLKVFEYYYNTIKVKLNKIDIVHAHSFKYAGFACCKIIKDIPIIITEHSSAILMNKLTMKDIKYLKYTLKCASEFICVSNALMSKVLKITQVCKKIVVIPNIIENKFCYQGESKWNKEFVLLSVSNLIHRKRVDVLIKSFGLAFKNCNDVVLRIVGKGEREKQVKKLIHELDLDNKVQLLGQLNREEVLNAYKTSNAFAMVSEHETFGVVYAESLMCGLPTIGTRNGGAEDILDCYGGYLCDVDDIKGIANKMLYIFENYENINRFKIYEDALARFSEHSVTNDIISVYNKIIEKTY